MLLDNINFDLDSKSFPFESNEELNQIRLDFELEIIDSKHLLTSTKFDCYFQGKDTEINSYNNFETLIKTNYFGVVYPENISLFTLLKNDNSTYDETFLKRKRSTQRKKRRENLDNMIKKIKTRFLNTALIKKLNEKFRNIGSRLNLEKFPKKFVSDINHKRNNKLLDMTLKGIFEKKELYQENELEKYYNNLKVIESEDIKNDAETKRIINKKFSELFEEYVNSEEFQVKEIERLKEKKMEDDYILKYINVAKYYVEYFSK